MKHFRLFIMMLFLCLGTAISWGQTTYKYRVIFESGVIPGGYTKTQQGSNVISTENNATVLISSRSLSSNNIGNYITANEVEDNDANIYLSTGSNDATMGYTGVIYITYNSNVSPVPEPWNDGTFEYSKIYTRGTVTIGSGNNEQYYYNNIYLPGNQVAVRLLMNEELTVKDTITSKTQISNNNLPDNYKALGYHAFASGSGNNSAYYYERTDQKVMGSTKSSVTIPSSTTHDGVNYAVTAIQKWGFAYEQGHVVFNSSGSINTSSNTSTGTCDLDHYWSQDSHSNWYLKTVRFADNCQIKSVGDYAFMSCTKLSSIQLPSCIQYMGQGIFEMCTALKECSFQNNTTNVQTLRYYTFWLCTVLESLELPEGITTIEGKPGGSAMQYLPSLTYIRLPNTLKEVGPHFLCCCSGLKTLTIPASVEYMDAASLHGCESLDAVYLLGSASALQEGDSGTSTFGANRTMCVDGVKNTVFYTTPDYIQSYASSTNKTWSWIADNTDSEGYLCEPEYNEDGTLKVDQNGKVVLAKDENGDYIYILDNDGQKVKPQTAKGWGNALAVITEEKRTFEKGKWVTAIFPNLMSHTFEGDTQPTEGYNVFSEEDSPCRVAKMTGATTTMGTDPVTKEAIRIYSLTFTLVPENKFETGVPYMFCPGRTVENYVMITEANMADEDFKAEMTVDHHYSVYSDKNDGEVIMKGYYSSWPLIPWDFYFKYRNSSDTKAMFYRVGALNTVTSLPTRCYWTVNVNGYRSQAGAKAANQRFFDETTGIENIKTKVVIEGIYDLNGHKLDINPEDLPKGLFIINGKKVMMK